MKKLTFVVLVAFLGLVACTTGNRAEKIEEKTLDTAKVVEQVNEIYTDVFHYYEMMANDSLKGRLTGIKPPAVKHCTRDWNDWVTKVNTFDAASQDGMMGFFEADYWVMGQDWGDLSVSDVQVTSMTDSTATVNLNLHNLGNPTAVRLEMRLEDGSWKIDNFVDVKNDMDWKANMKEYLSGETDNK